MQVERECPQWQGKRGALGAATAIAAAVCCFQACYMDARQVDVDLTMHRVILQQQAADTAGQVQGHRGGGRHTNVHQELGPKDQ